MRRPEDIRGWLGLGASLLVVAGLSMAGQRAAELTAGKDVTAAVGSLAQTREYAVQVDRVTLASAVHVEPAPAAAPEVRRTAEGVFVVVRWTTSGAPAPAAVHDVRLVTSDGQSFAPRVGLGAGLGGPAGTSSAALPAAARMVQPGFTLSYTTVFDVPPAVLVGAELVVPPVGWETPLYDVTVHIPLSPTPTMADAVAEADELRLDTRPTEGDR